MATDRAQVWFREVIAQLREQWTPGQEWAEIVALRDRLQKTLDGIIHTRQAARPTAVRKCSCCGGVMRPVISVRAVLLALGRFKIESDETVRQLEKAWATHRAVHNLNLEGRRKEPKEAGHQQESRRGAQADGAGERGDAADNPQETQR